MSEIVGLSTTDTIPGYEGFAQLIGPVSVYNGNPMEPQFDDVNNQLKERAEEMGGNAVLGIAYRKESGHFIATGTVFWLDKLKVREPRPRES